MDKKVIRILKKQHDKETVNSYQAEYEALGYKDIQAKYETFVKRNDIWSVINRDEVKTSELRAALEKEKNHVASSLCQKYVFMTLKEQAEKKTALRYSKAVSESNVAELEDIFVNYDPEGTFRKNYIKVCEEGGGS